MLFLIYAADHLNLNSGTSYCDEKELKSYQSGIGRLSEEIHRRAGTYMASMERRLCCKSYKGAHYCRLAFGSRFSSFISHPIFASPCINCHFQPCIFCVIITSFIVCIFLHRAILLMLLISFQCGSDFDLSQVGYKAHSPPSRSMLFNIIAQFLEILLLLFNRHC